MLRCLERWMGLMVGSLMVLGFPARAIDPETLLLLTDPLSFPEDLRLLELGRLPGNSSIITADTVSDAGLTIPSLWWARDQFGGKLLDNWLAYSGSDGTPRRVDLVVNQQIWSLYNYLERYTFVNQFGNAAQPYGYAVRVFNREQNLLAAYICEAGVASEENTTPAVPVCNMFLNSGGTGALQGRSRPFGGLPSTGGGIGQP